MNLLNSPLLYFFLGVLLGLYLGNKGIRIQVNNFIDKTIMKKSGKSEKIKTKDTTTYDD